MTDREQARAAARQRTLEAAERQLLVSSLARQGRAARLVVLAGQPLVSVGGKDDLSELAYDAAFNTNGRAKAFRCDTYDTAMMGGEPYAVWR